MDVSPSPVRWSAEDDLYAAIRKRQLLEPPIQNVVLKFVFGVSGRLEGCLRARRSVRRCGGHRPAHAALVFLLVDVALAADLHSPTTRKEVDQ